MDEYSQVLVAILATFLAGVLLLSIVALIKIIQVINRVKVLTDKAEAVTEKVEHLSNLFQKAAVPTVFIKLFSQAFKTFKKRSNKRRDADE